MVDPRLRAALVRLRAVRSRRPAGADPGDFADWRDAMADALDGLAGVLLFEDDRVRARAEADAARAQAEEVRRRGEVTSPDTA
ncbi:hypothetical protein GCM10018790_74970 [Kitasatospora xanthocidica]|uniref:hypothetical protein n=1 Tax=Kitasatospora xanthocidica TaxID=83382 RepID=UPI0019CF177F|nr:hypothetical protein [Kitasatospora xanthocidica]GHF86483.1 hypothetical protein GCM10018790_74970 [Kitasatospora xanthocidica]